jgi:broad-specificity NMP kinase
MRIAVTGTHGIGKTTFIDDLAAAYPGYECVAEPYWLLDQQGLPFSDGATIADLENSFPKAAN